MKQKILPFTEADLARYLDQYLQRGPYKRLLDRFFMGIVTSYTRNTQVNPVNGLIYTTSYTCQIQRTGESAPDGNTYYVLGDYAPVVGDTVECIWRDKNVGYVLGSLIPQHSRYAAHVTWPAGALVDVSQVWTKVPLSTVEYDHCGMFRSSTSDFLIPIPGKYQVNGAASDNGTAAGFAVGVFKNGSEYKRLFDGLRNTSGSSMGSSGFTSEYVANDVIDLRIFNRDTGNHNIFPDSRLCWMSVQFVAGL